MMKISAATRATHCDLDCLAFFEGEALQGQPGLNASQAKAAKRAGFDGKAGASLLLPSPEGPNLLLLGLGKKAAHCQEALRKAAQRAARQARDLKAVRFSLTLPKSPEAPETLARAAAEGAWLGLYRFTQCQGKPDGKKDPAELLLVGAGPKAKAALEEASVACQAVALARDLVNTPPSDMTPRIFVARARKALQGIKGVGVKVLGPAQAARLGMGGLGFVSRGSDEPAQLLHLIYKGPGAGPAKRVALVGKGVTFDSGGLSLKPSSGMEDMKCDMSGAAAALAALQAAARLRLPLELHAICALTENMPGPKAGKPGDVFTAMNGKTVEVLNTDAEGRLILADALCYADRLKPALCLDMATLTGAAISALGDELFAVLGDQAAVDKVLAAADRSGEGAWQLPLVESYKEHTKSRIADLKNIGKPGKAGTILGGLFLAEFKGSAPWAHLDIAGPAFLSAESGTLPAGATGVPVRTVLELLKQL